MKNTNYSVKKHQSYRLLLLALLIGGTMQAKVNHYMGAYGNIGEWSLLPSDSKTGASFGTAGGVGFLYELQAGRKYSTTRFLLDFGLGAQGGMTQFAQKAMLTHTLPGQLDLQGDNFDYVYEVSDRKDRYTNVALQVPVMIGVQHRKFYMLTGVKVNYSLMAKSFTTAVLNTYGDYADFGQFRNMEEYQFFSDRPLSNPADVKFELGLDASLEIGGRFGVITDAVGYDVPKRKVEYRMAAFVDYGLLTMHKAGTEPILQTPMLYDTRPASPDYVYNSTSMVDKVLLNNIITTSGFASAVHNFVVGVKFTVLFQLPEPGQCVICRENARQSGARRGRLKYEE